LEISRVKGSSPGSNGTPDENSQQGSDNPWILKAIEITEIYTS
jgi:hypothetical protein